MQLRGVRRDAKRWMAAPYRFQRVYDGEWERVNEYTWSRPSEMDSARVEIVD